VTRIRNRIGKFLFRRELYPLKHAETWGVLHRRCCGNSASRTVLQSSTSRTPSRPMTSWWPGASSSSDTGRDRRELDLVRHARSTQMPARNRHPFRTRPGG
jgi:hypothetical protein